MPAALSYLALAAILGSLAGCHLVFSHEPPRSDPGQPPDARSERALDRSSTLDASRDAPTKPDVATDLSRTDGTPDAKKLDGTKQPDAPKPDAKKLDAPKSDGKKVDAPKPDSKKLDAPKPDTKKPDAPKPDTKKLDAPKSDLPKPDSFILPFCVGGCMAFWTCCVKPPATQPACHLDRTGCLCDQATDAPCGGVTSWCCDFSSGAWRCTPNNTC